MQRSDQQSPLLKQIHLYKRKYYINTLLKGVLTAISLLLAGFAFVTAFEYYANMNSTGRAVLFFGYTGMLVFCCYYWIGVPVFKLIHLDKYLNDEEASKQIGTFFPEIKDKLLNTLQLHQSPSNSALATASINIRENSLSKYEFHKAIDLRENKKHARFVFIFLGLIGATLLINPNIVLDSSNRIINFRQAFIPFNFEIQNNTLAAHKNGDVTVEVKVVGDIVPAEVYIGDGQMKRKMIAKDGGFAFTFERIQQEKEIYFEASGYTSRLYKISIINHPELLESKLELKYPKYLDVSNKIVRNTNNITIPEGTKIDWTINTESTDLVLIEKGKSDKKYPTKNNMLTFSESYEDSENIKLALSNNSNKTTKEVNFLVNVVKDQYPKINFEQYKDTLLFNYLVVGGRATDDYGITALSISYSVKDEGQSIKKGKISLPVKRGNNNQNFTHQFLIDSLLTSPGQKLTYQITAWDNDGVNGRKYTKSQIYSFDIPSKRDLRNAIKEEKKKTENQMDMSMNKVDEISKKSKDLNKDLQSKSQADWNDKQNMEELLDEHKKLEKELNKLSNLFENQMEKQSRFEKPDPEEVEKMKQLKKMMDELLDEETKKLLDEMHKLMQEQADKEELQKMMEELSKKDEVMDKELERIMELFKELQLEQKMDQAIKDLEELAQKQQELAENTKDKKANNEELANEQQKLNEEFKDIQEDLEELEKMNSELEKPKELENTDSEQNSISQDQQKSHESLKDNKNNKASESQQDAAKKMQEMAEKMQEEQAGMQAEEVEENIDDLRQILSNLIVASKDQESLMEEFRTVNQADPRYVSLSQKQLKIREDVQIIEDSLYALSKRVFQLESFINKEVSELNDHLDNASEVLKARKPREATKDQQYAMTSMNNLALLLDDVLEQLQQQMQQMMANQNCNSGNCKKKGNSSGNKPGKKKGSSLSDLQKALNEKIQQLKKGQQDGRSISKELAESAAQQELIRRALKEMKEDLESGGNKAGGELDKISDLMEETEKDIVNKNITQETIERQKQIQTRLLKAEKSMREREYEEKREANTAKNVDRKLPPEVEKYIEERQKQIDLLKTVPPSLNPYYKKKVLQYFENIENYSQNY